MTTSVFTAAPRNGTDADFRIWGKGVSDALAAVGMVKTADTGQIDWTTVVKATASSYAGYEIWRFNDSLQATVPLFFKLEYGAGQSATDVGMRMTVGKGSDGAGAITTVLYSATDLRGGNGTSSATLYNWYVSSGDGSMLVICPAPGLFVGGTNTNTLFFNMDRSRSSTGTPTGTALMFYHGGNTPIGGTKVFTVHYASTGQFQLTTALPAVYPGGTTPLAFGGNTPLFPALATDGRGTFWSPRSALLGHITDLGAVGTTMSVSGYGTYMSMPNAGYGMAANTNTAIAWY